MRSAPVNRPSRSLYEIQENDGVDGVIFTGSFEVGFHLYKNFARRFPKPVIVEMGGKNPAIVSARADLEEAAEVLGIDAATLWRRRKKYGI